MSPLRLLFRAALCVIGGLSLSRPGGADVPARAATLAHVAGAPAGDSLAGAPIEPILNRYRVLAHYEVLSADPGESRADYSGLVVRTERPWLNLWLVDDKAKSLLTAISTVYVKLPGLPDTALHAVRPERLPLANPADLPLGDDIEDLAWVYGGDGRIWSSLVAVGEQGPDGAPHSWLYRIDLTRDGLIVKSAGAAPAPADEEVGNDGLEGVAARRLPDGQLEVYGLKERGQRLYTFIDTLDSNADRVLMPEAAPPRPPGRNFPSLTSIAGMSVQSGSCMRPGGRELFAIDRMKRRIALVPLPPLVAPPEARKRTRPRSAAPPRGPLQPRLWFDYTAIDSLLEGRTGETPPSLFGTCEGMAEDSAGRLYLLSDNNEANTSRLVVLQPRPETATPPR